MSRLLLALVAVMAMVVPVCAQEIEENYSRNWFGKDWLTVSGNGAGFEQSSAYGTVKFFSQYYEDDGADITIVTDDQFAGYLSKNWQVNLNNDFSVRAGFINDYQYKGSAGIELGLMSIDGDYNPLYYAYGSVGNYNDGEGVKRYFSASVEDVMGDKNLWGSEGVNRETSAGILEIAYKASEKLTTFSLLDPLTLGVISSTVYEGLDAYAGNDKMMNVFLGAYSEGVGVEGENMFYAVKVTATPEPLSCALFLIGGGALAFLRRRKA